MYIVLPVKYSLFLSDFNGTLIFSIDFRKNIQISTIVKIRSVGAELFHPDGRTDMTKLIVAFRSFANEPKNVSSIIGIAGGGGGGEGHGLDRSGSG
jgi:hypothetical protein